MSSQLDLDLARSAPAEPAVARARRGTFAFVRGALAWIPLWVPLLFLGQLVVRGLVPARAEKERLDAAEGEVRARVDALEHEERQLASDARMLSDPVFQERMRKSLRDPNSEPLTVERARTGSRP